MCSHLEFSQSLLWLGQVSTPPSRTCFFLSGSRFLRGSKRDAARDVSEWSYGRLVPLRFMTHDLNAYIMIGIIAL